MLFFSSHCFLSEPVRFGTVSFCSPRSVKDALFEGEATDQEPAPEVKKDDPFVDTCFIAGDQQVQILKAPRERLCLRLPEQFRWKVRAVIEEGTGTTEFVLDRDSLLQNVSLNNRQGLVCV
mgnify:CR=1 FL=1